MSLSIYPAGGNNRVPVIKLTAVKADDKIAGINPIQAEQKGVPLNSRGFQALDMS
ncbi:MAG: hypothetical protein KAH21_11635 [Spirochaetaceae bacterium]|nr:hypothetical protein [Spirochaetaceae bacterium]